MFFGDWANDNTSLAGKMSVLASQRDIVAHLRNECERVYGNSVTVTRGVRAVGGRVCEGEVVLEDSAGERSTRQFDLVVGADGAGSTVRDLMQEQVGLASHGWCILLACLQRMASASHESVNPGAHDSREILSTRRGWIGLLCLHGFLLDTARLRPGQGTRQAPMQWHSKMPDVYV